MKKIKLNKLINNIENNNRLNKFYFIKKQTGPLIASLIEEFDHSIRDISLEIHFRCNNPQYITR